MGQRSTPEVATPAAPLRIGRYVLYDQIGDGGMASVYLGGLLGPGGFSRKVAIKRLHAQFARDPDFVAMLLDEARLASKIHHPNVVSVIDIVAEDRELCLVMDYVHGAPLGRLLRAASERKERPPLAIAVAVAAQMLRGLDAAHEAKNERGEPLGIVHRDVSPQNVLIGVDGVARLIDFGVAKAVGRLQTTHSGSVKGKLAYMSPEQLMSLPVSRQSDVFSAGIVLWELLAGRRLFRAANEGATVALVMECKVEPPSRMDPTVPAALDAIVMRALERGASARYATAGEMAEELEQAAKAAPPAEIGAWVQTLASAELARLGCSIQAFEEVSAAHPIADIVAQVTKRSDPPITTVATPFAARSERWQPRRATVGLLTLLGVAVVAGMVTASRGVRKVSTGVADTDARPSASAALPSASASLPAPAPPSAAPSVAALASASPAPRPATNAAFPPPSRPKRPASKAAPPAPSPVVSPAPSASDDPDPKSYR